MMPPLARGAIGAAVSVAAHGAGALLLALALVPDPPPDQTAPESRLTLDTERVRERTAPQAEPDAPAAQERPAEGASLGAAPVAATRAHLADAAAARLPPTAPDTPLAPGADLPLSDAPPQTPEAQAAAAADIAAAPAGEASLAPQSVAAQAALAASLDAQPARPEALPDIRPIPSAASAVAPQASDRATEPPLSAETALPQDLPGTPIPEQRAPDRPIPDLTLAALPAAAVAPASERIVSDLAVASAEARPVAPAATPTPSDRPPALAVTPAVARAEPTQPSPAPPAIPAALRPAEAAPLPPAEATPDTALSVAAPARPVAPSEPPLAGAAEVEGPVTRQQAALALDGLGDIADPVSLAAVQAFLAPGAMPRADEIRNGLAGLLASVPCARLQVQFLPERGVVELHGHVPEPNAAAPVLAGLRAQLGTDLPVEPNLQVLPRPQCDVLSRIDALGLPQSTDQTLDSRLVGPETHAREFTFSEGEALVLELGAPVYDAYFYVDYFDAAGQVIHLVPNEFEPLRLAPAESLQAIGTRDPSQPGLHLRIAPPFGQEVVLAYAATRPLYEGLRPTVEPAEPYLAELSRLIDAAHAADPDFRGEWVYFLVVTRPN